VDLVGNSFGGALALALAIRAPQRVRRLVLMGSVGVPFAITPGLDAVWGYEPSIQTMRALMDTFAWDRSLVNDELAKLRYEASIRPGFQESFSAMFPAPRQRWVDAMASPEADIRALPHETLILHGREDKVIPLQTSLTLSQWIPNASCMCSATAATGRRSSTPPASPAWSATSWPRPTRPDAPLIHRFTLHTEPPWTLPSSSTTATSSTRRCKAASPSPR
jgi:pimeloyl-ACP methyl ester carboxylesterase